MPLTLQDIQAEKQRRALLYQIQGEKQRRMAAGRVQSPGVVAPTNPPPPSIRQGIGDFRQIERGGYTGEPMGVGDLRMIERSESGARVPQGDASFLNPSSVFTGLVSKIATLGERANRGLIRPVAEKHARIQDVVEPGGERIVSRGMEYGARMSGDFAVEGIPGFANRLVNPGEYGSTIGGQVKEAGSGLIGGIKKAGAQIGEEIHQTARDLGVKGEENPMRQVYHDLGADKTFDEAVAEYNQDPSGWLQTATVAKGLGQTGAGLVRGLKSRTAVPEKAPIEPKIETEPIAKAEPETLTPQKTPEEIAIPPTKVPVSESPTPRQLPTTTENVSQPAPVEIYHRSHVKLKGDGPDFGAFFGNKDFDNAFGGDFGPHIYKRTIPESVQRDIVDLNGGDARSRQIMADLAAKQFPNDKAFADELLRGDKKAIQDFYDIWTDKDPSLEYMREKGIGGLKHGDEYLLSKETIDKLSTNVSPLPNSPPVSPQGAKPPVEPPKPPTEKLAEPPEPEKNVSSLSIRTEADAIAKKLTDDFGSLPEYKTMDMREQANRAKGLIDTDVEQAKRIAMGLEAAPEGLRDASVYEAVKLDALKNGDVELLRKLAVESTVPSKLSAYGQEIKASDSKLMDDPVRVMQDVVKTRQEYAKRTGQRYTSEEIERLKTKLADAEKKLAERVITATKKAYGAKNRIVSTQAYLAAKARIRESLATAHSGIPPELLAEVSKIGAYHLEAGTRVFADWSAKMIEDLGDKIKPHLNDLWRSIGDDRRLQISLKAQKTRLERETGKYQGKLEGLDFSKPEKRTLVLDPEARRLKVLRDVAKRDWESALNSYGSVTKEEAGNIVKLSKEMTAKLGELEKGGDRLEYGAARVAYENYVNYLKGEQTPLRTLAKAGIDKFKTTAQTNKAKAVYDLGTDALKVIVNNSVSMVATLDNSFLGRQGLKTLMVKPNVWAKGAVNSFADIWKTLGGKDAHSALMADVYSRPNYLNGSYEKAGILAKVEEQYPSSLPERIPGVGRVFKASENAFTGSAIRMRTGLYDLWAKQAAESGIDMTDAAQIKPLGKLINSLTARGQWGKTGEPAVVRLVMWAPKMLKGNIDVLTAHGGGIGLESSFARKQAAINLLKIVTETATLMTIANALKPGSAETDPRSSDFGKIRIGNTRYDFTGGAASIVTLAARIATGERKSTNTGEMIPYGTKYGQASELDALVDFLANKTNPPAHVVVDWLRGRDYAGEPFSLGREAFRATTPIIVQQAINLKDDHSANAVAGLILDGLGVNSATYAPKPVKEKKEKAPDKPKVKVGPISQADIDSIPAHIQVKYQGIKSKSGEKVQMTGSARQVLKDLYAESELYTKILESLV